jgi:hypothetical protein
MRISIYSYHIETVLNNNAIESDASKISIDYAFKKDATAALLRLSDRYPSARVCEVERCFDISNPDQLRAYQDLISQLFDSCTTEIPD